MSEKAQSQIPLAIIGLSCRLPGARNVEEFWRLVASGLDATGELPEEVFDRELYYDRQMGVVGKSYSAVGGLVPRLPFDNTKCRLSEELIGASDIAHLTACEVASDALRDASFDPFNLPTRHVGVFIGHTGGSVKAGDVVYSIYVEQTAQYLHEVKSLETLSPAEIDRMAQQLTADVRERCDPRARNKAFDASSNNCASLIARAFGLDGPCVVVDAACASSLQALSLAARALQLGHLDMAVVGGASFCKSDSLVLFSQAQSVSAGKSCPFDEHANGLVTAEGYVTFVMKTLPKAVADGDKVRCVIRGLGMSADGRGKSLWAPRKEGQIIAMQRAYPDTLRPEDIQYIEAHATSTQVGDATELAALGEFFPTTIGSERKIPLGSVKGNIGHTLETAGVAGLLKSVLAMEKGIIPPVANLTQPNLAVPWADLPFYLPTKAEPWHRLSEGTPRRAAVNAFGIGGLNVHVVLEEYVPVAEQACVPAMPHHREPIAVIGMGAILPGAKTVDAFWDLLLSGKSAVTDVPADRWNPAQFYDATGTQAYRSSSKRGGYITDYHYEWRRHKVPPKQIANANPLQFMLLDATEQALAQAGYLEKTFDRDRVGVIVGTMFGGDFSNQLQAGLRLPEFVRALSRLLAERGLRDSQIAEAAHEYEKVLLTHMPALLDETGSFTSSTLASRITKTYDFKGGAMALDAGLGSGLAALDACVNLLRTGTCDMMICAAGQRSMDLVAYECGTRGGFLASGDPRACYDTNFHGAVPGEGCGVLLLKRLSDARRDGDPILGVLRGVAAATDWVEPGTAARRAVQRGLALSGTATSDVLAVEGLGTATDVAEAEVRALNDVLGSRDRTQPVVLNSLVSQFGFTGAVHGIAATIKSLCALTQGQLPAGVTSANPRPDLFGSTCVRIAHQTMPVQDPEQSALGVMCGLDLGTVYMTLVESAAKGTKPASGKVEPINLPLPAKLRIVRVAASSWSSLRNRLLSESVKELYQPDRQFAAGDRVRMAVVCADAEDFSGKCRALAEQIGDGQVSDRLGLAKTGVFLGEPKPSSSGCAFVFPGQGSQYQGMLAQLIEELPEAQLACRRVDAAMASLGYESFAQIAGKDVQTLGKDVWKTQVAMLLADYIVEDTLHQLGLRPTLVAGHSHGQYPAMVCAGAWSLTDAIRCTRYRAESIATVTGVDGCMAATNAPVAVVQRIVAAVGDGVYVANFNAPDETVIAGRRSAVEQAIAELKRARHAATIIKVPCPYHTPLMAEAGHRFASHLPEIQLRDSRIPVVSTATYNMLSSGEDLADSVVKQFTRPVNYSAILRTILDARPSLIVEVGPKQVLTNLNRKNCQHDDVVFLASDVPQRRGAAALLDVLAQADCLGCLDSRERPAVAATSAKCVIPGRIVTFDATERRRSKMRQQGMASAGKSVSPATRTDSPPSVRRVSQPVAITATLRSKSQPTADSAVQDAASLAPDFDVAVLTMRAATQEPLPATSPAQASVVVQSAPVASGMTVLTDDPNVDPEEIRRVLVDFVVEQTGYPDEMVEMEADLEADLGIDSIKKAQLFGEVGERFQIAPREDLSLDDFPTLQHVLQFLLVELAANPDDVSCGEPASPCVAEIVPRTPSPVLEVGTAAVQRETEFERSGVRIQVLEGTPQVCGWSHGVEHRAAIHYELAALVDGPHLLNGHGPATWPSPWSEELAGLAAGASANLEAVVALNSRALSVTSLRTGFGDATSGRLSPPERQAITLVQVRKPVEGMRYLTIGRPGMLLPVAGINAARLVISSEPLDIPASPHDVALATQWLHQVMATSQDHAMAEQLLAQLSLEGRWCFGLGVAGKSETSYWVCEGGRNRRDRSAASPQQQALHQMLERDPSTLVLTDRQTGMTHKIVLDEVVPRLVPVPVVMESECHETLLSAMRRHVLRMTISRRDPLSASRIYVPGDLVVVAGGTLIGKVLCQRLAQEGCRPVEIAGPNGVRMFADVIQREVPKHLVLLTDAEPTKLALEEFRATEHFVAPVEICRTWIEALERTGSMAGTSLVAVTRLGGDFGFHSFHPQFAGGGLTGLLKGIRREFPPIRVKILDFDREATSEFVVRELMDEVNSHGTEAEVGWSGTQRCVVQAVAQTAPRDLRRDITRGGVWVVTGGGRGITSVVARELGRRYGLKLHLLGTIPQPTPQDPWRDLDEQQLRRLKREMAQRARQQGKDPADESRRLENAIELDRNLARFAGEHVSATYHACDIRDRQALRNVLAQIRLQDGPIAGIIHGAGTEFSGKFVRKRAEKVAMTIASKCDGAANLIALTHDDPLEHFVAFGSTSGRFGGLGQADYSLASDLLAKMVDRLASERPDCVAVCFHWPGWDEVGMAVRPESRMTMPGQMLLMPTHDGVTHLVSELRSGAGEREILILDVPDFLDTDGTMRRLSAPLDPQSRRAQPTSAAGGNGDASGATTSWATGINARSRFDCSRMPLIEAVVAGEAAGTYVAAVKLSPSQDPFLVHHRFRGKPFLPGVISLELFAEAAAVLQRSDRIIELRDVRLERGWAFNDLRPCDATIQLSECVGGVRCELRGPFCNSQGEVLETERVYASGFVQIGDSLPTIKPMDPGKPVFDWTPFFYPENSLIHHGAPFRTFEKLDFQHGGGRAIIIGKARNELIGDRRSGGMLTAGAAIDGCLVACGMFGYCMLEKFIELPQGIQRYRQLRLPHEGERCRLRFFYRGGSREGNVYDIVLIGEDGDVVFDIEGYQTTRVQENS